MAFVFDFRISLGIVFQVIAPTYLMLHLTIFGFVFGMTKSFLVACRVHCMCECVCTCVDRLSFETFLRKMSPGAYF